MFVEPYTHLSFLRLLLLAPSGPLAVIAVPPIRKAYGWKPTEKIPTSYPRKSPAMSLVRLLCTKQIIDSAGNPPRSRTLSVPNRPREAVSAYDDEPEA